MKNIVFFDSADYERIYLENALGKIFNCEFVRDTLNDLSVLSDVQKSAEIISCFTTSRISDKVLKQFPNLKLIALRSVGFNHVDIDYCREKGIAVENTPNYGNMTVAEFAFALLLDVSRKVTNSYNNLKNLQIDASQTVGVELFGKTIGIIGLGAIGAEMARLSYGFGLNILGFDLREREDLKLKYSVNYTDFNTLIENSDIISLHTPLTKDNYHIFNSEVFSRMKPSAVLINTARGELIDTQALYNAIVENKIAGAGLDVLESEETLTDIEYLVDVGRMNVNSLQKTVLNNNLLKLDNVIITPHIAYDTKEAIRRILDFTISNIRAFAEGKIQNNVY